MSEQVKKPIRHYVSDEELVIFRTWLKEQYDKKIDRDIPNDPLSDPEEVKRLAVDCIIETMLQDLDEPGFDWS